MIIGLLDTITLLPAFVNVGSKTNKSKTLYSFTSIHLFLLYVYGNSYLQNIVVPLHSLKDNYTKM